MPQDVTLKEYAEHAWNNSRFLDANVTANFADNAPLLDVLPFRNIGLGKLTYDFIRESALPDAAYRGVNESYTPSFGEVKPLQESVKLLGAILRTDTAIAGYEQQEAVSAQGFLSNQALMHIRSLALKVQKTFLKGDSSTNPKEVDGLQSRIGNGSSQLITPGTTNSGDALSIGNLVEGVLNTRNPTHIVMSLKMFIRYQQFVNDNNNSIVRSTYDEFGNFVENFNGIPILIMDEDGEGNQILPFTESNPNASATATGSTSIYVISASPGHLYGIQQEPMRTREIGEDPNSPHLISKIDWNHGLVLQDARSVTRIAGIADAAITT